MMENGKTTTQTHARSRQGRMAEFTAQNPQGDVTPLTAQVIQRTHAPSMLTRGDVLALQRTMGNRAVTKLLGRDRPANGPETDGPPIRVQRKLVVGPANDPYEQEADTISNQVMRQTHAPPAVGKAAKDDGVLRRRAKSSAPPSMGAAGGEVDGQLAGRIRQAQRGGSALHNRVRRRLEPHLRADLNGVKVHTGPQAVQLNRDLGAKAFTHKEHIFYGAGQSPSDLRLTTHEAVHVVQQGAAKGIGQRKANRAQTKATVGPQGDAQAKDANPAATSVMRMLAAPHIRPAAPNLRRVLNPAAIQRTLMSSDKFKSSTNTRRRGGYIKEVDSALKKYEKNKTPGTLTGLRFVIEQYLTTKGDGTDEKATQARALLAQVMEDERGLSPANQLEGLLPFKNEIIAMGSKGKLLKDLNAKLIGANSVLREELKKAIIESPKSPETLQAKVGALDLTGDQKPIQKLIQELSKGSTPRKVAIYHSLYARCMEMVSTMNEGHEDWRDFSSTLKDKPALRDLAAPIVDVTKIFADSFDLSYHQKKTQQRTMAQAEMKAAGTPSLDVVVMGAGPVGMIAAIEAFLAGANVNVYEMRRTTPNRANVLKLTDPSMHKLRRIGVYGVLFGPDSPKGSDSVEQGKGISVGLLEDALRTKAEQLGIKITYGYELDTITAPGEEGGKTKVRLKKYVPTRAGPEMDLYNQLGAEPTHIDATSDLVIGATGAGGATRSKLGLTSDRRGGDEGEEYIDFTAVGIFTADHKKVMAPAADKERDNAWVVGLRTPVVDYLLTQINREQFIKFKDDKGTRDTWVLERGRNLMKYTGALQQSSVFDITLNQAQEFVSQEASGILIGDEAATPHPLTGSGFNTGASSTDLVPSLVRGLGKGNKDEAFKSYSSGVKGKTDKMVGLGQKFFEKNIKKLSEMNKLPEPPKKTVHYTPEDIGVTEETQGAYDFAQQRVMAQLGMPTGLHHGNLSEYGPGYDDPEEAYKEAQRKVEALYKLPSVREEER